MKKKKTWAGAVGSILRVVVIVLPSVVIISGMITVAYLSTHDASSQIEFETPGLRFRFEGQRSALPEGAS